MLTRKKIKKRFWPQWKRWNFLVSFSEQSTLLGSDRFYTTHSYLSVNVSLLSPLLMGGLTCFKAGIQHQTWFVALAFHSSSRWQETWNRSKAAIFSLVFPTQKKLGTRGEKQEQVSAACCWPGVFQHRQPEKAAFINFLSLRVINLSVH